MKLKNTPPRVRFSATIILLSIFFVRCTDTGVKPEVKLNQPDLTTDEIKRLVLLDSTFVYSANEARQDAFSVASELDMEDARKGRKTIRTIEEQITVSIQDTIMFPKTDRSKSNDPGFHIFNFSNKKGFAIISGDKRAFGRLGWSGNGKIEPESEITMFLTRAVNYIQAKRAETEAMRGDNIHVSLLEKLSGFDVTKTGNGNANGRIDIGCAEMRRGRPFPCENPCELTSYSILLSSSPSTNIIVPQLLQTEWSQTTPYNNNFGSSYCGDRWDYCGLNVNHNYYAGCVPIAASQVIAYYWGQNPARARFGVDWPIIAGTEKACYLSSDQVNNVANLVSNVYGSYGFGFKNCTGIGDNGTFTFPYPENAICSSYGFVQGEWRSYNKGDLESSLRNGSPVPTYGTKHLWCNCVVWIPFAGCVWEPCVGDLTSYHEWVQDGLETIATRSTYRFYPVDYSSCSSLPSYDVTYVTNLNTYVHNNWGWGGSNNGWYIEGAFGGADSGGTSNVYSYNHDDNIIAYITPLQ
jgi:hypothetical protein